MNLNFAFFCVPISIPHSSSVEDVVFVLTIPKLRFFRDKKYMTNLSVYENLKLKFLKALLCIIDTTDI